MSCFHQGVSAELLRASGCSRREAGLAGGWSGVARGSGCLAAQGGEGRGWKVWVEKPPPGGGGGRLLKGGWRLVLPVQLATDPSFSLCYPGSVSRQPQGPGKEHWPRHSGLVPPGLLPPRTSGRSELGLPTACLLCTQSRHFCGLM